MRIDERQRQYIKELSASRSTAKEVFEFVRDLVEVEQQRKGISVTQYIRLGDLWSLLDCQVRQAKEEA